MGQVTDHEQITYSYVIRHMADGLSGLLLLAVLAGLLAVHDVVQAWKYTARYNAAAECLSSAISTAQPTGACNELLQP